MKNQLYSRNAFIHKAIFMLAFLTSMQAYGQDTLRNAAGWDLNFSGYINSHYIVEKTKDVDGTIHSVQNGLLPASLTFSATKMAAGWKVNSTISMFYGITSNQALAFSPLDARQVFFSASKEKVGSFAIGRNFGLFGLDAILGDVSLLGVGAGLAPENPGHTTLGGIAYGYYYTDRLNQINYTTPSFGGLTATIGVYQALDALLTDVTNDPSRPGIHGKLAFASDQLTASATFINQGSLTADGREVSASGFDIFAKITAVENLAITGYFSSGKGLEDVLVGTPLLSDGGNEYKSNTYYFQAAYTFSGNTLTAYYGQSQNTDLDNSNTRLSFHFQRPAFGASILNLGVNLLGGAVAGVDKANKTQLSVGWFLPF